MSVGILADMLVTAEHRLQVRYNLKLKLLYKFLSLSWAVAI